MRQVTIEAAEADLPELVDAACRGEDIVIVREGRPLVRLVPMTPRPFRIGLLAGLVGTGPDFLAPMDDEGIDAWEGRTEQPL